jgi:glycosyltransferase involved in cell wall biosynthesis
MRIAIPTLGCDGRLSGISRYTVQIIREFLRSPDVKQVRLLSLRGEEDIFDPTPGQALTTTVSPVFRSAMPSLIWHQLVLPPHVRGSDILFLPAGNRRLPLLAPAATVGVVHDLSSLHVQGKYSFTRDVYIKRVLPILIRRLDTVVTVSESSKRDIVSYCRIPPERVTVIPHGVDTAAFKPGPADVARERVKSRLPAAPYFLYVSRIEYPGKNHLRLIAAFARALAVTNAPHHLVLTGTDRERAEEVHAAAENSPVANRIHFAGFVPDEVLPDIYRASTALIFPSLYEGFGFPLIEAMACGIPVACGSVSSLPEVAGDAALYFDPLSEESIAAQLVALIRDEGLRRDVAERGLARSARFRWEEVGRDTVAVLRRTLSARRPTG